MFLSMGSHCTVPVFATSLDHRGHDGDRLSDEEKGSHARARGGLTRWLARAAEAGTPRGQIKRPRAAFGGERGGEVRRRRPSQKAAGLLRSPRAFASPPLTEDTRPSPGRDARSAVIFAPQGVT